MTGSYITCDDPDCDTSFVYFAGDSWRIRSAATDSGWTTGDEGDYCPTHAGSGLEVAA